MKTAKRTEREIRYRAIRERYNSLLEQGWDKTPIYETLAREYGYALTTICNIVKHREWKRTETTNRES